MLGSGFHNRLFHSDVTVPRPRVPRGYEVPSSGPFDEPAPQRVSSVTGLGGTWRGTEAHHGPASARALYVAVARNRRRRGRRVCPPDAVGTHQEPVFDTVTVPQMRGEERIKRAEHERQRGCGDAQGAVVGRVEWVEDEKRENCRPNRRGDCVRAAGEENEAGEGIG